MENKNNTLNFCQVSLVRDLPLILINFKELKKIYKEFKLYVICPSKEFDVFKKELNFEQIKVISEDDIIPFDKFKYIFDQEMTSSSFKNLMHDRLQWYYQQLLKISFVLDFVSKKNQKIVIWDADTIILKKIKFFKNDLSVKYGTVFEFHKPYYNTNEVLFKKLPNCYLSFVCQFVALSPKECSFFLSRANEFLEKQKSTSEWFAKIMFRIINEGNSIYSGSLFSEFELIGMSNYLLKNDKQKSLNTLRYGLNGILTKNQTVVSKVLGISHVTYEHSHPNENSKGMLKRDQSWKIFIKILIKNFYKYFLRTTRHNFNFFLKKNS